jgi:hypothetical protein
MKDWWMWLNRVAIILGGVVIVVYATVALFAIQQNVIVVGRNYWNAPLFAVLQLIVAVTCAPFLLRYAIRHWNDKRPPLQN